MKFQTSELSEDDNFILDINDNLIKMIKQFERKHLGNGYRLHVSFHVDKAGDKIIYARKSQCRQQVPTKRYIDKIKTKYNDDILIDKSTNECLNFTSNKKKIDF